jgi:hypothetical protein
LLQSYLRAPELSWVLGALKLSRLLRFLPHPPRRSEFVQRRPLEPAKLARSILVKLGLLVLCAVVGVAVGIAPELAVAVSDTRLLGGLPHPDLEAVLRVCRARRRERGELLLRATDDAVLMAVRDGGGWRVSLGYTIAENIRIEDFTEGQLVAEPRKGRQPAPLLGMAVSLVVRSDRWPPETPWREVTDRGRLTTHDPEGDLLYGAGVAVHPDARVLHRGRLPEAQRDALDAHLDPHVDPSLAVRAVYGRWLPWLLLLDEAWVLGLVRHVRARSSREQESGVTQGPNSE